jgi:DHA1 family tetracycline resistance protein-like MFS transporter
MSTPAPLPPSSSPPPHALRIIFIIVLMDLLGFGLIIPLMPIYARQFNASPLQVTLLFAIYSACQFIASPILGAASDRYGRRPVLILSQFGSALGYLLLGLVTQHHWVNPNVGLALVYLSRVIDGFTAGNISTAQAYVADVTTPQSRSRGMAILGVAFGLGFAAGPFLGGIFGEHHPSWPAYIAAGFAALAAVMTFLKLPESMVHKPTEEAQLWLHPSTFKPVLRTPAIPQLLLVGFLCMAAFVMMEASIVMFLADRFHWGPRYASWFFAFLGLVIIVVQGRLFGPLVKIFGEWRLAIAGPLLIALGMACFIEAGFKPVLTILLLGGALNAGGRSLWQPSYSSLLSKFADPRQQGIVFGLFHGLASLARVAGPITAGLLYEPRRAIGPFLAAAFILIGTATWTMVLRIRHPLPTMEEGSPGFEPVIET